MYPILSVVTGLANRSAVLSGNIIEQLIWPWASCSTVFPPRVGIFSVTVARLVLSVLTRLLTRAKPSSSIYLRELEEQESHTITSRLYQPWAHTQEKPKLPAARVALLYSKLLSSQGSSQHVLKRTHRVRRLRLRETRSLLMHPEPRDEPETGQGLSSLPHEDNPFRGSL